MIMRIREILTTLVDEAKILHWDGPNAAWRHQREVCSTCAAVMDAQAMLTINFLDFQRGDRVRIGDSIPPLSFGVVDRVTMAVDVRMGYCTAEGVQPLTGGPIGRFDAADLTRVSGQVRRDGGCSAEQ